MLRYVPERYFVIGVLGAAGLLISAATAQSRQIEFLPPSVPRPHTAPPPVGTGSISGRVVDGTTAAAVARARVQLIGRDARPSVMTDSSGAFSLDALPAGSYTLSVDRAGYQPSSFPDRGRKIRSPARPIILQADQVVKGISVPLYRGGVIAGRVTDAHGEPIEWVQVRALKVAARGGLASGPGAGNAGSTNDLGEFRLTGLAPGSYVVVATSPMFARNGGPWDGAGENRSHPAPTYYPNVVSMEQAQAVPVQRGQTVTGTDISMSEAFMGRLNGTVVDSNGAPVTRNGSVSISTSFRDGFGGGGSTSTQLRPDGTFSALVAPGDYVVEGRVVSDKSARAGWEPPLLMGVESVSVTSGESETVLITVGKAATASGRVVFEGTARPPESPGSLQLPLASPNGRPCSAGQTVVAPDWSFTVDGLLGTCISHTYQAGRWMVKSVLYNGDDLLDDPITFKPGGDYHDVQVVVTDRRTDIAFAVTTGGQPTREYVAVVFPARRGRWTPGPGFEPARAFVPPPPRTVVQDVRAAPGATGERADDPVRREVMQGLRPGEYLAVAVDNIGFDDLRDPAVLDKLASVATKLVVGDAARVEVSLRLFTFDDVMR